MDEKRQNLQRHENTINQLVDKFKDMVFNTSIGFLGNVADAEDATQDTFISIYQNLDGFNEQSEIKTWIYRITVNVCLQQLRRRKIRPSGGSVEEMPPLLDFVHPGVKLENKELATTLYNAVQNLPENQKAVFTLQKIEGLSHEEIGEIMDKSKSSIESLMHRAKENLKIALQSYRKEYHGK